MKIALVHNEYGKLSGEEVVVNQLADLLTKRDHAVVRFTRSSVEIPGKRFGQIQAFLAGIYNLFSRRAFARFLDAERPDIVHIHNLFPFISPSILPECARHGVPVVMTLHNFRLLCPNALLMRNGQVCHECLGGHEWRCLRHNCEGDWPKSAGYTLRTAFARRSGWFHRHVTRFICLTRFERDIYVQEGFPAQRMTVIPNAAAVGQRTRDQGPKTRDRSLVPDNSHLSYVGRISPEKDVPTLLAAAKLLPEIPFKIAGSYARMPELVSHRPANVEFVGHLDQDQLDEFYHRTAILAFTTRWYECFPTVLLQAMAHGIPIVCTRIGGLPEIVEDGRTGLLYDPGNAADLAAKIQQLWTDPNLRERLGAAGLDKARREYSEDVVFSGHLRVYEGCVKDED